MNLETTRLLINKLESSDKQDYFDNIAHSKIVLETFMDTYRESIDDFPFDKYMKIPNLFAIRLKETNKLIGIILIVEQKDGYLEVGYAIGEKYWNNGYTSEAFKAYIDYLFKNTEVNRIQALAFKENIPSMRVMEKCGLEMIYEVTNGLTYHDKSIDLMHYEIRRETYEEQHCSR